MAVTVTISRGARVVNPDPTLPQSGTVILGDSAAALVRHPKALLVAEGGATFVFPLAPLSAEHDGYAPTFSGVDREGRKPLLYLADVPLETLQFTCTLRAPGDVTGQVSIEETILEPLRVTVRAAPKFTIQRMGFTERGIWACTGLKLTTTARQHGTNLTTRASAAFSFVEYVTAAGVAKVGPVSGGAVVPPARPAPAAAPSAPAPAPETYVVAGGDTLVKIATRFYGTPTRWKDLAAANSLRDANLIYPRQRLRIPRP